jgi:hypothetical protein
MKRPCSKSLVVSEFFILAFVLLGTSSSSCCHGLVLQAPAYRNFLNNHFSTVCAANEMISLVDTATVAPQDDKQVTVDQQRTMQLLGSAFTQKLIELQDYKMKHGNCLVPRRYEENPSLGNFVNKQRQSYRKFLLGEKSSMNEVSCFLCVYYA